MCDCRVATDKPAKPNQQTRMQEMQMIQFYLIGKKKVKGKMCYFQFLYTTITNLWEGLITLIKYYEALQQTKKYWKTFFHFINLSTLHYLNYLL